MVWRSFWMDVFLLLILPGIWAKIQTILHTSVVWDELIVYLQLVVFPIQGYVATYSGFLFIQWFVLLTHLSTPSKACLRCQIRSDSFLTKSKDKNLPFHILSISCQFILGKYKLLGVGTNQLATFKCLSWFGFETLLGCEPPEGMKYFVTKPCSPVMEMKKNALGYSLLTYPKQSGGLWPADSLSLIQFSLIPRIIGCQSHTPFIFQSPLPSSSPFSMWGLAF